MKQFNKNCLANIIVLMLSIFILTSCGGSNAGSSGSNSNPSSTSVKAPINANNLPLVWTFDGYAAPASGFTINDMVWHLLTITVTDHDTPLATPIPIGGIAAEIYPVPTDKRGESVEIQDINCDTALFSKTGDTCSVYIRAFYDISTGTKTTPTIPIHLSTNAESLGEEQTLYFVERALFSYPSGDYRAVLPIETKYYVGSAVQSNPIQYSILDMKNATNPPLTISTLSTSTNPNIVLMNRQSAESNDPYYGPYSQCSLTANPSLKQVNYLESAGDECILVYQAAASTTTTIESTNITLNTSTGTIDPWYITNLKLIANYVNGTPIQPYMQNGSSFIVNSGSATPSGTSMKMLTDGVLSSGTIDPSPEPFKLVNLSYVFNPNRMGQAPYGIPYYQNGVINVADQNSMGMPTSILTDASTTNPVTVGKATEQIAGGTASGSTMTCSACGGSCASSTAQIVPGSTTLAYNGQVHLIMDNDSNSNCGNDAGNHVEVDIPFSGYNATVFSNDQQGCGGNNWDDGANITVNTKGCSGNTCTYAVTVTASHGGVGNQCRNTQSNTFNLTFTRSAVYTQLSSLQGFTLRTNSPAFVGRAGQNMNAMLGTQGGTVAQTMDCGTFAQYGTCGANGIYSNGLSATNMLYNVGLKAGDYLANGTVNFTRSDGYDISSFTSSQ